MTEEPGPLLASGRAADVYDLGDGTVLRRYRTDHDTTQEADTMGWVAEQGLPVPRVHAAAGRDIVMELVTGPTLLEDLQRRPWALPGHARMLARLQRRLNSLHAPDWFPSRSGVPAGRSVLHLDFHPMNVILGPDGPAIIDWTNAGRGDPDLDAAMTVALIAPFETSSARDRAGQRILLAVFRHFRGRAAIRRALPAAYRLRLADQNLTDAERVYLERGLARIR